MISQKILMNKMNNLTLPSLISASVLKFKDKTALSFVGREQITYGELSVKIRSTMRFLEQLGIKPGDKVAILSTNMPNWGVAYLAIVSMGAVVVPILPDFHPDEISNVIQHSEAKAVFISRGLIPKLSGSGDRAIGHKIIMEDFSLIDPGQNAPGYVAGTVSHQNYPVKEDDLAAIIYTSGTTGKSKGVMLTHRNICTNTLDCSKVQHIDENDRFLSILPLSHTYENTVGFILPLYRGASVFYLEKPPTAPVLLPALKEVKPTLMLSVPLIIDKIYRKQVLPSLTKNRILSAIYKIPFFRKKLNIVAGRKLMQIFGGELRFFGIGGAKLDRTVEQFLKEARFPYAIGYGLTETSPLLAGVNPQHTRLESTGPAVESVQLRINDPHPVTGEGEIWAKGPTVMQGYYKDQTLTEEVLTQDGWFKTGDLGAFDQDGYLYIRGRLKNLIVRASGENIYPEEIESVINNYPYVSESLIVDRKGQLAALVHFNREELEEKTANLKEEVSQYVEDKIEAMKEDLRSYVNARVNKFSKVNLIITQHEPFQKTATQKIKRFLYR